MSSSRASFLILLVLVITLVSLCLLTDPVEGMKIILQRRKKHHEHKHHEHHECCHESVHEPMMHYPMHMHGWGDSFGSMGGGFGFGGLGGWGGLALRGMLQ